MLLTTMPSGLDYLALFSLYSFGLSFVASILIIGIIAVIKKNTKSFKKYLILWLKIFGIMFFGSLLTAFIFFVAV